jgi:hypothetical protein
MLRCLARASCALLVLLRLLKKRELPWLQTVARINREHSNDGLTVALVVVVVVAAKRSKAVVAMVIGLRSVPSVGDGKILLCIEPHFEGEDSADGRAGENQSDGYALFWRKALRFHVTHSI